MKSLVIDLDQTICFADNEAESQSEDKNVKYVNARPDLDVIDRLREYHRDGFRITIHTSRNMRTYNGDVEAIRANSLPLITDWLERHDVPYHEIVVGKPWCGFEGFYVDDRSIRPSEFRALSRDEINAVLARERRA